MCPRSSTDENFDIIFLKIICVPAIRAGRCRDIIVERVLCTYKDNTTPGTRLSHAILHAPVSEVAQYTLFRRHSNARHARFRFDLDLTRITRIRLTTARISHYFARTHIRFTCSVTRPLFG